MVIARQADVATATADDGNHIIDVLPLRDTFQLARDGLHRPISLKQGRKKCLLKAVTPGVALQNFQKIGVAFAGLNGYYSQALGHRRKNQGLISSEDSLFVKAFDTRQFFPLKLPQRMNRIDIQNAKG